MNDEIKALKERIEKLESIIVYLISSKGVLHDRGTTNSTDQLLQSALNSVDAYEAAKSLIEGYDGTEQVIQNSYTIIESRLAKKREHWND